MSQDVRRRVTHAPPSGDSKVIQHAAEGTSPADIVKRHVPGQPFGNPFATRQPRFMDVPAESYHNMMNTVADVQSEFNKLPARLKGKFHNNPYQMMRWIQNPDNRKEALKLGLVVPTEDEAAQLAVEAAKARRTDQVDLIREAMRPDPEAQPEYKSGKPPEGGKT